MAICIDAPKITINGVSIDVVQTTDPIKKGHLVEWIDSQGGDSSNVTNGFDDIYADEPTMQAGSSSAGYKAPTNLPDDQIPAADRNAILHPTTVAANPVEDVIIHGDIDYGLKLSKNISLEDLTLTPVAERNSYIRPQAGRSNQEIITNLKGLSVNCLEPIFGQFGRPTITSGFRHGAANRSQHCKGQAADLQWVSEDTSYHLSVAQWIRKNVSYDQLILEKSIRTGNYWIHVSFNRAGNRSPENGAKFGTMVGGGSYRWGRLFV